MTSNPTYYPNVSTPGIARFTAGGPPDVVVASEAWARVFVFNGLNGADRYFWHQPGFPMLFEDNPVQAPSLGELNGTSDGIPEIVIGHGNQTEANVDTTASLLYRSMGAKSAACIDSIPLPGRREERQPKGLGYPILADFDGDGAVEILQVSNQGGLFAWEAVWSDLTKSFSCVPEKGWPIVFDEQPGTVAVGNIDGDSFLELVVAVDDGYVHTFDLPGAAAGNIQWATAAHDARRTGNLEGGGSGAGSQPDFDPDLASGTSAPVVIGKNPTGGGTEIRFQIPATGRVRVTIHDVAGRLVQTVIDETRSRGPHAVFWNGRLQTGAKASNGVYFARVEAGPFEATRKIVVQR